MLRFTVDTKPIDEYINDLRVAKKESVFAIGAGAQAIIATTYLQKLYQGPMGAFGYPKADHPKLSQNVSLRVDDDSSEVFSIDPEAVYVEFGTGIFSEIGGKRYIYPKNAKSLAFPVWRLPPDFKGFFIKREDMENTSKLPPAAIGIVLAKRVAGQKVVHVWFSPETTKKIDRLADATLKAFGS